MVNLQLTQETLNSLSQGQTVTFIKDGQTITIGTKEQETTIKPMMEKSYSDKYQDNFKNGNSYRC